MRACVCTVHVRGEVIHKENCVSEYFVPFSLIKPSSSVPCMRLWTAHYGRYKSQVSSVFRQMT